MKRICGNCVFCLIACDGERLCSLASNEYGTKDEDDHWIAGRLVHPEDECIYPENSGYLSFCPVEPMVNMARAYPGWCRKPNSRVLEALETQGGDKGMLYTILTSVMVGKSDKDVVDIMDKIKPLGLTPGKIYKMLDEMVSAGKLVKDDDDNYQRPEHLSMREKVANPYSLKGGQSAITKTTNL